MKSGRRWLIPSLDATFYVASFLKSSEDASGDTSDGDFIWQGVLTAAMAIAAFERIGLAVLFLEPDARARESKLQGC
jgi:hypothetical protein